MDNLRKCLSENKVLPTCALRGSWPDLEASAAGALDLHSDYKVVAVLHADDPAFIASSCGALNDLLFDVAVYAKRHRAQFDLFSNKII